MGYNKPGIYLTHHERLAAGEIGAPQRPSDASPFKGEFSGAMV